MIAESKGIIPGAPFSAFTANVYLMDLDRYFYNAHVEYMRYSDDILILADDEAALQSHILHVKEVLAERGLQINPDKECFIYPGEKWESDSLKAGTVFSSMCSILFSVSASVFRSFQTLISMLSISIILNGSAVKEWKLSRVLSRAGLQPVLTL